MTRRRVDRAIILAAGRGSRLATASGLPKPLKPVAGVALLARIIRTLAGEGLREIVVVLGFEGAQIRAALAALDEPGVELHFVDNPAWEKSNGMSVLAAAEWIDRDCILSMSDHLYAPELVRRLLRAELPPGACALGVDYDPERCFDLPDATKVRAAGPLIEEIGKDLLDFNAIDTGVFRINPSLVDALRTVARERGDASLSDGVRALASRGRFHVTDVGEARWIDVDTPEAHARAEAMVRVFGDELGDEPSGEGRIDPESMEFYAPTWVRGAPPYREEHFQAAGVQEGRAKPGEFARLMSNESPFAPSATVVEAVMRALSRSQRYPDPLQSRDLRRRLAEPAGLCEESCVLGAGSAEVIDLVVRTFVAPGEEAIVPVPTFSMYEARTRVAGGVPVVVPMGDDLEVCASAVLAAVTERTKLIFVCSPNNPTGLRVAEGELRRVLRLGIPTLVDEAYVEFGDDDRSVASLLAEYPNAMVVRTFSKAYGLAGLRLGYVLACVPVARLISRVKLPWNVSSVAVAAALAVLDDEAEFARRRNHVRSERRYLQRELERLPGVSVFASAANFVLLDIQDTGHSADSLVQALLADGVAIRGLASHHLKRGYVRVSIGSPEDNRRCVEALRRAVVRHRARPQVSAPG